MFCSNFLKGYHICVYLLNCKDHWCFMVSGIGPCRVHFHFHTKREVYLQFETEKTNVTRHDEFLDELLLVV